MCSGWESRWAKYLAGQILTESRGRGRPMNSGRRCSCCVRVSGRGVGWSCSSVRLTLFLVPSPQRRQRKRMIELECFSVNSVVESQENKTEN